MEKIKTVLRDIMPCWYELSWRRTTPAIVFRAHQDFLNGVKKINLVEAPGVWGFQQEFGFNDFDGNFESDYFGFEKTFRKMKRVKGDEFVNFLVEIPVVKKETEIKCDICKGTGKNDCPDVKCLMCNGRGKKYKYDWKTAYAVSATFTLFFQLTRFFQHKQETNSSLPQLMIINTIIKRDTMGHGGSLGGEFSVPMVNWMRLFEPNTILSEMLQAMKGAYKRMFGLDKFDEYSFSAYISNEKGGFNNSCPGDACGLYSESLHIDKYQGYEFSCHNVDTPMQQLTLLAGLAALHDRARREIKP